MQYHWLTTARYQPQAVFIKAFYNETSLLHQLQELRQKFPFSFDLVGTLHFVWKEKNSNAAQTIHLRIDR